jgi:hypothetical protein
MSPDLILKGTALFAALASFVLSVTLYFQASSDLERQRVRIDPGGL